MAIQTTVIGAYPKPPDEGGPFVLRKTLNALDKGGATQEDVARAVEDLTRAMIAEHESAGIDVITDGQAGWEDLLTPFARAFSGFEIGGLLRWFDNNVYYRRPVATGPIASRRPAAVQAFEFAASVATAPVKAVIPGPVTFARLSIDDYYREHRGFVMAIAGALAKEAAALEDAGARFIQIDEPALLDAPEDLELAREALGVVTGALTSAETTLATYFGDAKRLGSDLFGLPVDRIGLDLVSGPENRALIDELPGTKRLQAGIVDARNTMLEDVGALTATIEDLATAVGPDRLWVAPSAPLEFLPREKARAKLHRLAEAAQKVGV